MQRAATWETGRGAGESHEEKQVTKIFATQECAKGRRPALVGPRDARKQRARSRWRRLYLVRSKTDRRVSQAFRREKQAPESRSLSLGDVDAEFLSQSRRKEPFAKPQARARARENGTATSVR